MVSALRGDCFVFFFFFLKNASTAKRLLDKNTHFGKRASVATGMKAFQTKGAKFRADTEILRIRHVAIGILPYVKTASLGLDTNLATSAVFDMSRLKRSPEKRQRKMVLKDQLLY